MFIHQSVERTSATFFAEMRRAAYVTPTSYLELLNTFSKLLEERRESLGKTRGRLAVGLDKLASTAVAVEGMQVRIPIVPTCMVLHGYCTVFLSSALCSTQGG